MKQIVDLARDLCMKWMDGVREGGTRRAWEHPEDVVRLLLEEMPSDADTAERNARAIVAWLHDVLEDGRLPGGARVSWEDVGDVGIPQYLVDDVIQLTNGESDKLSYLTRLRRMSPRARTVKCADRICNLREGSESFSDKRWIRYVGEALYFVYPLASDLGAEGLWLQERMLDAVRLRPLG